METPKAKIVIIPYHAWYPHECWTLKREQKGKLESIKEKQTRRMEINKEKPEENNGYD
jgi:hypothetical protein